MKQEKRKPTNLTLLPSVVKDAKKKLKIKKDGSLSGKVETLLKVWLTASLIFFFLSCSKTNDKPADPVYTITMSLDYAAQTYLDSVVLNGRKIFLHMGPSQSQTINLPGGGDISIYVSGGGGGDYVLINALKQIIPQPSFAGQQQKFTGTIPGNENSAIVITKKQ